MELEIPVTASASIHLNRRRPYVIQAVWEPLAPPLESYLRLQFSDGSMTTAVHVTLDLNQARELRYALSGAIEAAIKEIDSRI